MKPEFAALTETAALIAPELLDLEGARPRLRISHCRGCGHDTFPSARVCPACISQDMEGRSVEGAGTLYSFSIVHAAPAHWNAPYAIGYVDLPDGLRILGQIQQPADEIAIGGRYSLDIGIVGRNAEGQPASSYVFVPETADA